MTRMIDRVLGREKGQWPFFLAVLAKMAVITGTFYLVSRHSRTAVLMLILGLSVIVAAVITEAVLQMCRSLFNGRT